MGRSRRKKESFIDELYETLVELPYWVGPLLAFGAFAFVRWFVPWACGAVDPENKLATTFYTLLSVIAVKHSHWAAVAVLIVWIFALLGKCVNYRRLDRQTGIESIRGLSWQDFERLLAEAYWRQGYSVEHVGQPGPDGGVDIRLCRSNERVLVQCKRWRTWKVGVKEARELYGIVAAERATRGILVTAGRFSADAIAFARTVPLELVNGHELVQMIAEVQRSPRIASNEQPVAELLCPKCGAAMKLRTAKQGANAGSQFWGCSRYPACTTT